MPQRDRPRGMGMLVVAGTALVLVGCSGGGSTNSAAPPEMEPELGPAPSAPQNEVNVIYGRGAVEQGQIDLLLDIYQSGEVCTSLRPFVLMIHGGGFRGGSKSDFVWPRFGAALAERGIVAVSIDYRLIGDRPIPSPAYDGFRNALLAGAGDRELGPEEIAQLDAITSAVEDGVTAINWVQRNGADRCINGSRFAIWGSSAGGAIGLMAAYGLDDYAVSVPNPKTMIDYWSQIPVDGLMAFNDPPLFIVHGTSDETVPYTAALSLKAQAHDASVPYSFYSVIGAGHGHIEVPVDEILVDGRSLQDVTVDFVVAQLSGGTPVYEERDVNRP